MNKKLIFALAVPLLGLAGCDDETAANNTSTEELNPGSGPGDAVALDASVTYELNGRLGDKFYLELNPGVYTATLEGYSSNTEEYGDDVPVIDQQKTNIEIRELSGNDEPQNVSTRTTLHQNRNLGGETFRFYVSEYTRVVIDSVELEGADPVADYMSEYSFEFNYTLAADSSSPYNGEWQSTRTATADCGDYTAAEPEVRNKDVRVVDDYLYISDVSDKLYPANRFYTVSEDEISYRLLMSSRSERDDVVLRGESDESITIRVEDDKLVGEGKYEYSETTDDDSTDKKECSTELEYEATIDPA